MKFMMDENGHVWLLLPGDPGDWTLDDLIAARLFGYFDSCEGENWENGGEEGDDEPDPAAET